MAPLRSVGSLIEGVRAGLGHPGRRRAGGVGTSEAQELLHSASVDLESYERFQPGDQDVQAALEKRKPSFKRVTLEMLLELLHRARVEDRVRPLASEWSERLLVFAEVRTTALSRRANDKFGDVPLESLGLLAIIVLFLEQYRNTEDLRFFNGALTVLDLGVVRRLRHEWCCVDEETLLTFVHQRLETVAATEVVSIQ